MAFTKTFGNALKIVTNKNGGKLPKICGNMCANAFGNCW